MKIFFKKRKWLIVCSVFAVMILSLCAWVYGWGAGKIDIMDFDAADVERIELSCGAIGFDSVVVTEKEDIHAMIDMVNSFRDTGNEIKNILKYGIGASSTVLYEFDVFFSDGEEFIFCFGSSDGDQELSDIEVGYWVYQPGKTKLFADTCRGSLELFYELYEKYSTLG